MLEPLLRQHQVYLQGVPLLSEEVAGHRQHRNASVLELDRATTEQRRVVLAVSEGVKYTIGLDVRAQHVVHGHLSGGYEHEQIGCGGGGAQPVGKQRHVFS